jgi:hypothetical protein
MPIVGEKLEVEAGEGRTAPGWAVLLSALPTAALDKLVGSMADQLGLPREQARAGLFEEGFATLESGDVVLCRTVEDGRAHWSKAKEVSRG